MLIWSNLPVKTREITLGKFIFSEFQPVGTAVQRAARAAMSRTSSVRSVGVTSTSSQAARARRVPR